MKSCEGASNDEARVDKGRRTFGQIERGCSQSLIQSLREKPVLLTAVGSRTIVGIAIERRALRWRRSFGGLFFGPILPFPKLPILDCIYNKIYPFYVGKNGLWVSFCRTYRIFYYSTHLYYGFCLEFFVSLELRYLLNIRRISHIGPK